MSPASPEGPPASPSRYRVRPRQGSDFAAISALAERIYPQSIHPPEAVWTAELLASHLKFFPEGQWVALREEGELVGDSTALRVDRRKALAPHTWDAITGEGTLATHDANGDTFYGVDIMVEPAAQGSGVGSLLYQARFELARRLGCTAFVAGARIPGYLGVAATMTVEAYVDDVVAGRRFDPTLSRQLQQGFEVAGILPHYFRDPESLNYAVLITRPIG